MNLRMIGLAAVVVFTALLPLAASAGPVDGPESDVEATGGAAGLLADAKTGLSSLSGINGSGTAGSAGGTGNNAVTAGTRDTGAEARTSERCGPEVASPEGIEAQTCVLTTARDRPDTWARTYYRNETGGELLAVLSLMGPYGRTVQTRCPIETGDEPAICETPREPSRGEHTAYMAVAEFSASANSANSANGGNGWNGRSSGNGGEIEGNGAEIEPLLLRSGSNSPAPAAR
ncbi:hypothetical protein [Streptomyces scopuliridis]|uniref:hypothetical protein n=1 Tax=Streptomyces scopuliridis TaxID=452529 RepID=UPI003427A8EF